MEHFKVGFEMKGEVIFVGDEEALMTGPRVKVNVKLEGRQVCGLTADSTRTTLRDIGDPSVWGPHEVTKVLGVLGIKLGALIERDEEFRAAIGAITASQKEREQKRQRPRGFLAGKDVYGGVPPRADAPVPVEA